MQGTIYYLEREYFTSFYCLVREYEGQEHTFTFLKENIESADLLFIAKNNLGSPDSILIRFGEEVDQNKELLGSGNFDECIKLAKMHGLLNN